MKKLLSLIAICFSLAIVGQPNKYLTDAFLKNDSFFTVKSDAILFRGAVIFPATTSSTPTLNYLPEKGNYISISSGNALGQIGYWNIAIGDNAFDSSNSPNTSYNICLGKDAGKSLNGGRDNNFIGWDVGYHTKGGTGNIGIVEDALYSNIGGSDNIALGRGSLYSAQFPMSNIGIGYNTLYYNEEGTENTAVGSYALGFVKRGYGNTAIGAYAGEVNDTSAATMYNNVFIGYIAGLSSPGVSNTICIGYNTNTSQFGEINIGNKIRFRNNSFEISGSNVTINGYTYHITNSPPVGVQSQLIADGFGNATWTPVSSAIAQKQIVQNGFSDDGPIYIYGYDGTFKGLGYKQSRR